jgi:hypothetical protein
MARKTSQAYKQAPWRRQLQTVSVSLLPVIAIAVVVSIYLIVSAQSASAGLEIMDMHYEEEEILRSIANLRTDLAWKTSYTEMKKRAENLGYQVAPTESVHFMTIPGYQGQSAVLIAPPPGNENTLSPIINDYYQQSLADWFLKTFLTASQSSSGGAQ